MKRYHDLSGKLENGLWSYQALPGLEQIIPDVQIETIATVDKDDFFASRITLSTISGTYVEAGSHILKEGKTLDEYGIGDFIKPATIIRLPRQPEKTMVDKSLLVSHAPNIPKGEALIVDTGWGIQWNKPGYVLQCPNFSQNAVEWLLEHKPSICAFDVPCLESSWSEDVVEEKGGLLGMMFNRGALLVAPLINLEQIKSDRGMLYCLPLSVAGTSGAPARIVFEEEV
ncbi:MAG: cyclase family protein [Spirochaetaceae bacterium]|nr:MAG: cyclase family protein [Spirochaetaceae bacterium]